MRSKLGLVGLLSAGILGIAGCGDGHAAYEKKFSNVADYSIETHTIDQVFRDHDGWRVFYTEEKTKQLIEIRIDTRYKFEYPEIKEKAQFKGLGSEELNSNVMVYRDLPEEEEPCIKIIYFRLEDTPPAYGKSSVYAEIHLRDKDKISPGSEVWGGKFPTRDDMKEVK